MPREKILIYLVIAAAVAVIGFSLYLSGKTAVPASDIVPDNISQAPVTNFEECESAGYPVMESYPRQCRTREGGLFVEQIATPVPAPEENTPGGCYVGGCSGEVCSGEPGAISTCIYRPEYSCYKSAKCERQATGACGWTQTPALSACLSNPPLGK